MDKPRDGGLTKKNIFVYALFENYWPFFNFFLYLVIISLYLAIHRKEKKITKNKTKVVRADLQDFAFDLDFFKF